MKKNRSKKEQEEQELNAALKLCRILLSAEGYRPSHELQHYRTLAALPEILGETKKADAEYLNNCRKKRNIVEYDDVGGFGVGRG